MKIKTKVENLLLFLLQFFILLLFNFTKNFKIDEAISIYCSENYFSDCINWDVQLPTFYFWLKISSNIFGFNLLVQKTIIAIIVSFSIFTIVKSIEILKSLSFFKKLLISIIISLIPLYYSSVWLRPYAFSLLFSSLSLFYFLKFLEERKKELLLFSFIFDIIGTSFFYFNFILSLVKILYLGNKENLKFISLYLLLLPFLLVNLKNLEVRKQSISWYESFSDYFYIFLLNFPIELFKNLTYTKLDFYFLITSKFSQLILFLPFFTKNRFKFLYLYLFLFILFLEIFFTTFNHYLILSRHFIPITNWILALLIISLNNEFLISFLVLPFVFYINHDILYIFSPSLEIVYFSISQNSKILIHPFTLSSEIWYFEKIHKRNITIYDDFPSSNFSCISTRKWDKNMILSKFEEIEIKLIKNDEDYERICCKEKLFEIKIVNDKFVICK
jgi:hypothetical protein